MYEGLTTENSQSIDLWFFSCQSLMMSHPTDCSGRASVMQVSGSGQYFGPKSVWQVRIDKHRPGSFDKGSIHTFCHPILLWVFGIVNSWRTPSAIRCVSNSLEVNSPPLSVRIALSFLPVDLTTMAFHSRNFSNIWFLELKKIYRPIHNEFYCK